MALSNALLMSWVAHARLRPKKNAFRYRVYYLVIALSKLAELNHPRLLSLNRFNLFGLRALDYGNGKLPPEDWARGVLAEWKLAEIANGEIILMTMPRLLGYVFNPVSFWFCLDSAGQLRAVISEVTNTFRDRHCYISFRDDLAPITEEDWLESQKVFHVSPFLTIEGTYRYRFIYGEEKIGVFIHHHDNDGLVLTTSVVGHRKPLSSGNLLLAMLRCPFVIMGLIHYQAIKLTVKGVRYHRRPAPPAIEVTR